jgi:hypothetical protein
MFGTMSVSLTLRFFDEIYYSDGFCIRSFKWMRVGTFWTP